MNLNTGIHVDKKNIDNNLDAFYNTSLSYINTLTGSDSNILFICKLDNTKEKFISHLDEEIRSKNGKLDLTGSPLKDDCAIDIIDDMSFEPKLSTTVPWSFSEKCYNSIELPKAKQILTDYNLQTKPKNDIGSIWALCDASDLDKTVLLHINFDPLWNERGIVTFKGLMSVNHASFTDMISVHHLKIKNSQKIETIIDTYFNVKSNIVLKFSRCSTSSKPNLYDYKNSDAILYQTINIDDPHSVAQHFWRQLYILSIIKDDIIKFKNEVGDNREGVYRCGSGISTHDLRQEIVSIMTELSATCDEDTGAENNNIETVILKAKIRHSVDLTDKLWEILKNCSSYKDLKAGFNFVFQCAAKCNVANMPTNKNRLAEIIREVSQHRLAIPCLVGSEPIELLLEIGLEKLTKDYEFIFTESHICGDLQVYNSKSENVSKSLENNYNVRTSFQNTVEMNTTSVRSSKQSERMTLLHTKNLTHTPERNDFIGFQNSIFNEKEMNCKLSKLAQIHLILEHILSIQINSNLENVSNQICEQLLQRPITSIDKIKDKVSDSIEIPLITDKILPLIENKDVQARKIIMKSQNKYKKVESTYYYNMDNIFPPNVFAGIHTDDKEVKKQNMYYCYHYTKFATKRSQYFKT